MRIIKVSVTVNGSGDGTAISSEPGVNGSLYAVQLVDGDFADGVDVVLTFEQGDVSVPVLTSANWNTDQIVYPRAAEVGVADAAATGGTCMPIALGQFKAVVAQGGDTKSGSFIAYVTEL